MPSATVLQNGTVPSSVHSRGVCFGLNERRKECRLDGSDEESKVTGMASSILGTAENFPQILAFCVTYAKSLLCFQSHTTSLPNCVYFFPIKRRGFGPPTHPKKKNWGDTLGNIVGWFLLRKFDFINFYMVSSCSILFPDFRTVFVFALRPFLPMWVHFFGFNGNFNGKMTKINEMAKNHFS